MNALNALSGRSAAETPGIAPIGEELIASFRVRRQEIAALGQLPADIVAELRRLGVYRALVSTRYGGLEASPATFLKLIERLSEADGSIGWVASFGVSSMYLASLPTGTLAKVYADGPDVIFAGALFPPQAAAKVEGGLKVSGRWKFGSGSTGADIIGVGVKVEGEKGGLPRMAVMPASSVAIERNWDVIGLQGTGSHDLVVDGVVVPEEWTFIRGGPPTLDTPLYRYPSMAFAAQVLAIVGVGVARAALDEITQMAGGRASITGAPLLADRAYVQTEIAKAEAKLRSARAFFYEVTEDVWAALCAGDPASLKQTGLLRLASSHVARIGCEVAQTAFMLSGTTGIYNDHPLAAYVHDAMVVAQHAFLSEGTFASAGRVLLGLDNPPGFP